MEPEKKKKKFSDPMLSDLKERALSIGSELTQETLDSNDWNYAVDLELLKFKLGKSTDEEQMRIGRLISECLTERANGNTESAEPAVFRPSQDTTTNVGEAPIGSPEPEDKQFTTPTLINQAIMMMSQYKQYVIRQAGRGSTSSISNLVQPQQGTSSNAMKIQPKWMGAARQEVDMVLSSFNRFFENEFRITQRDHPLYNDMILDKVFAYLPPSSWPTCRLVNHQWNSNVVRFIRKKHDPVHILYPEGVSKFCSSYANTEQFSLSNISFSIYSPRNDALTFFTNYGANLKKLTLQIDPFQDLDDPISLSQVFRHILRNVPHLDSIGFFGDAPKPNEFVLDESELMDYQLPQVKSLTLSCPTMSTEFLDGLLTILPNVYSLEINLNGQRIENIDDLFNPITASLSKIRLTRFSMKLPEPNDQDPPRIIPSNFWIELGTQELRYLKIHNWKEVSDTNNFQTLCQNLSNSLEVLIIKSCSVPLLFNHRIMLPPMTKLEQLSVTSGELLPIHLPVSSQFPRLRSLFFKSDSLRSIFGVSQDWMQVVELEVHDINLWGVQDLGTHFPNLRKLVQVGYGYTSTERVALLPRVFPRLEDLELFVKEQNMNNTLTGLTADNIKMFTPIIGQPYQEDLFSRIDVSGSFLLRFRELRRLKLHILCKKEGSPCVVDLIAVHLALLRMKPLLELTLIGDFTIADDLVAKLTAHHRSLILRKSLSPPKPLRFRNFS